MKKKLLMVSLSMVMVLGAAGIVNATTLGNNAAAMQPKVSNAYMENNSVTGTETEQTENAQVDQTIPSTDLQTQNTSVKTQMQNMPMVNTQTQNMPIMNTQTQTMPMNPQTQTMPMNNQMSSQYMQGTIGSNDSNSSETSQHSTQRSSSKSMGSMGRMGR